ncbi:MAG: HEPN domain-containing protein [Methylobacter sp.]|uniref:HEPN domain-containing protein n=1 Tax=Methylobacter sp. TaxID=2051955 RepID=UPI00272F1183|nr:HEPN domain-containing protein [Methylobacter sp.]MDP1666151.1 HEPN domain-containing protein [Methylobacter sp.]
MLQSVNGFLESIDSLLAHIEFENDRNMFFQSGSKKYVGDSELEEEFRWFVENKIRPALINSKSFTYKNAIISLYGYLENYLEEIVKEYIGAIEKHCDQFTKLPSGIKKNHLNSSIELINKVQKVKASSLEYKNRTLKEIVRNMYTCMHDGSNFSVNLDAFALHTANFRYDSIHALFQKIGITGISKKCLEKANFVRELASKHSIDSTVDRKVLTSLLISELDDLAQRRNEIAHGVVLNDIESLDLLRSRILLVRSYGKAINEVVSDSLNQFLYSISKKIYLGKPAKLFQKINVFSFLPNIEYDCLGENEIRVGDLIYAENHKSKEKIIVGDIISIRKGGDTSLDNLSLPPSDPYSIGVNFKITSHMSNRDIYVAKQ